MHVAHQFDSDVNYINYTFEKERPGPPVFWSFTPCLVVCIHVPQTGKWAVLTILWLSCMFWAVKSHTKAYNRSEAPLKDSSWWIAPPRHGNDMCVWRCSTSRGKHSLKSQKVGISRVTSRWARFESHVKIPINVGGLKEVVIFSQILIFF